MQINAATLDIPAGAVLLNGLYLAVECTMQGNAALRELALQGVGLTGGSALGYRGYTGDLANGSTVNYVGGGIGYSTNALATFMSDSIMGNTAFAAMNAAVMAIGDTMWNRTYKGADFHA